MLQHPRAACRPCLMPSRFILDRIRAAADDRAGLRPNNTDKCRTGRSHGAAFSSGFIFLQRLSNVEFNILEQIENLNLESIQTDSERTAATETHLLVRNRPETEGCVRTAKSRGRGCRTSRGGFERVVKMKVRAPCIADRAGYNRTVEVRAAT